MRRGRTPRAACAIACATERGPRWGAGMWRRAARATIAVAAAALAPAALAVVVLTAALFATGCSSLVLEPAADGWSRNYLADNARWDGPGPMLTATFQPDAAENPVQIVLAPPESGLASVRILAEGVEPGTAIGLVESPRWSPARVLRAGDEFPVGVPPPADDGTPDAEPTSHAAPASRSALLRLAAGAATGSAGEGDVVAYSLLYTDDSGDGTVPIRFTVVREGRVGKVLLVGVLLPVAVAFLVLAACPPCAVALISLHH